MVAFAGALSNLGLKPALLAGGHGASRSMSELQNILATQ
jgi:hypothetical protein